MPPYQFASDLPFILVMPDALLYENISVILQVALFREQKKIFKMAPIPSSF